ncbi:MAG: class I SAM-dependent methyltransferase [Holosporales bacterium]|jgi:SAM-dependent methyltransferase|nr:class I SAM-dependent methyltransferase [Holosporales bacterium]
MEQNNPQKAHFERVHDLYSAHYYDVLSMRYREEFVYGPLFQGIDLNNKDVLDLASGGGANTQALLKRFPGARFTGCDISEKACADYLAETGCPSFQADLTKPLKHQKVYDMVVVLSALHHCVTNLPVVLENVYKLLKPEGYFLMFEPNSRCFLECVRKFWYKHDPSFEAESEASLDHDHLLHMANDRGNRFTAEMIKYFGGPAFYLIYNSMIFRVPLGLKPIIAPPLTFCERIYNKLPWKWLHSSFLAQWRKLPLS